MHLQYKLQKNKNIIHDRTSTEMTNPYAATTLNKQQFASSLLNTMMCVDKINFFLEHNYIKVLSATEVQIESTGKSLEKCFTFSRSCTWNYF